MEQKTLLVTIDLEKPKEVSELEFFDLRREIFGLFVSVNGRVIRSPLDAKQPDKIFGCFEVAPQLKEIVESTLYDGLKLTTDFNTKISFEEIDSVIDPASYIYLS